MTRVRFPLPAPDGQDESGSQEKGGSQEKADRRDDRSDAHIAQSVEHFLGKEEVIGSIPIVSTIRRARSKGWPGVGTAR